MPEKRGIHLRMLWWSAGCVMLNFAIDVTVSKYGSHWPDWIIVALWILPLIPFAIWSFLHEKFLLQRSWIKSQFAEHPVSFTLIVMMFLAVGVSQTMRIASRFQKSAAITSAVPLPVAQQAPSISPQPQVAAQPSMSHTQQAQPSKNAPVPQSTPVDSTYTAGERPAPQPTYGAQTCVGSACAQGPGSQAVFNQGAALRIPQGSIKKLADDLALCHSGSVMVSTNVVNPTGVTHKDAENLVAAFAQTHSWNYGAVGTLIKGQDVGLNGPIPDPTGFHIKTSRQNRNLAECVQGALKNSIGVDSVVEQDETEVNSIVITVGGEEE